MGRWARVRKEMAQREINRALKIKKIVSSIPFADFIEVHLGLTVIKITVKS